MFLFLRRWLRRGPPDPIIALTMVERGARWISIEQISDAVQAASGTAPKIREERPGYFRFWSLGYEFTLINRPGRYFPQTQSASRDLILDEIVAEHTSAIIMDCWAAPKGKERIDSTDLMGRILDALIVPDSLGIHCFHTQRLNPVDDHLRSLLQMGLAMDAMSKSTSPHIQGFEAMDEAMNAAIVEAQARWPDFVEAFQSREVTGSTDFFVKARFEEGDHIEHMWLIPMEVRSNGFIGTLNSQPYFISTVAFGDRVEVTRDDISDWAFMTPIGRVGAFSAHLFAASKDSDDD